MGLGSSTAADLIQCPHCAYPLSAKETGELTSGSMVKCKRCCGTYYPKGGAPGPITERRRSRRSLSGKRKSPITEDISSPLMSSATDTKPDADSVEASETALLRPSSHSPSSEIISSSSISVSISSGDTSDVLQYLWLGFFNDSLFGMDEEKEESISEDGLIDSHLKPFFHSQPPDLMIEKGMHIFCKSSAHFRVRGCFPPKGRVNDSITQIFVSDGRKSILEREVFVLHHRPIVKMHILPALETFKTTQIYRDGISKSSVSSASSSAASAMSDTPASFQLDKTFESHIKPYLKENDVCLMEDTRGPPITERRHFIQGDTFVENGVEFKIMACEPEDGNVTAETQIFVAGRPIADLRTLTVKPVIDTLPEEIRALSAQRQFDLTLRPYLFGLNNGRHYLSTEIKELTVNGVLFRIMDPPSQLLSDDETRRSVAMSQGGLFSQLTAVVPWSSALTAAELEEMRVEDDLRLARRLQEEEDRREREAVEQRSRRSDRPTRYVVQFGHQRLEIPPDSEAAQVLEQLNQQRMNRGPMDPASAQRWQHLDSFIERTAILVHLQELQRQRDGERERRRALPDIDISRLPTWEFKGAATPSTVGKDGADAADDDPAVFPSEDDANSCRICLEKFEDGTMVKALPCMHLYHVDCIDHWLHMNRNCPICKSDISEGLRSDVGSL